MPDAQPSEPGESLCEEGLLSLSQEAKLCGRVGNGLILRSTQRGPQLAEATLQAQGELFTFQPLAMGTKKHRLDSIESGAVAHHRSGQCLVRTAGDH